MSKKHFHKKNDPHLNREKGQYEHPVPSREYITKYIEEIGRPVSFRHLREAFELDSEEEQEGLKRRLIAMQRDGQLIANRRGGYAVVANMPTVKGVIQANRDGSGYVISEDKAQSDIYLPSREMQQVFHGDRVLVSVVATKWKANEGRVLEVLEHNTQQIVGKLCREKGMYFVDPNNKSISQDVMVAENEIGKAKVGQFVVLEITHQPTKNSRASGRVVDVLGDQMTPGIEVELAVRSYSLPFVWPEKVIAQAQAIPPTIPESAIAEREDLRQLPFVTIDGEDAKDFDDAVYCEPSKNGYRLYVAIADVSHYVRDESELDREAFVRGNSVYFPAKVIPMLPETLSNNLCSLRPKCDRLTLTCIMDLNSDGVIQSYRFANTVIHSRARLTYTEVAAMLAGEKTEHAFIYPHLKPLYDLYLKLIRQRDLRGAINFDTIETKIVFNENGKIEKIEPRVRNDAHKIIEEAMLAANVCAARFLEKAEMPALYRIHEQPKREKLEAFHEFLKPFGLKLSGGAHPTTLDYAKLLERIEKRDDSILLQTVMLRSMMQAVYSPDNAGHFGLSYEGYTHFTSPIRRYPDLIVHRAIKYLLAEKKRAGFKYNHADMEKFAEHCSMTERRADRATRDATDWLKCEFMLDKLGKIYHARIVDVTSFGIFVELIEEYVQGLVHITNLKNDYYQFDNVNHLLRGKKSGKVYRLGDALTVMVAKVDLDERRIDFEVVDPEASKKKT